MASINKNDLGFLGESFQYRLAHEFMDNHTFFEDLSPIVDQNMFTDPTLKTFVGVIKNYYEREGNVPSYDSLEIELRNLSHSDRETETYVAILNKIKSISSDGSDRTKELAQKFFKQQNIIKTANEILKIAGSGNLERYDECVDLLNEAMTKGVHNDFGEHVFDHLNETLSDDYRVPIPTGIGKIDEVLEGGLGKGELGVIIGPSGFGKVQPYDAKIITPNGIRQMGDIKVGDYVIGRNGKPTKVIGVFPHKNWQFYRITFSDGVSTECGKEHLWAVNSKSQRRRKTYSKELHRKVYNPDNSFKVLSLEEIMEQGLYKGKHHTYNFKIPMAEPTQFEKIDVKLDPYFVGYMIGDGCFSRGDISVGTQDIKEASVLLSETKVPFKQFYYEKRNIYSLSYNKEIMDIFREYYDTNIKSDQKYIHHDYLYNSLENRIAILNGLMDSDGTCMKNGCSCFNTKSHQLALDVKTLVLSLGGFATVREKKCGYFNKKYQEYRDCGIGYEVTITLCDPSIPIFRLSRKQERVKYRREQKDFRFIKSIEKSKVCDGQCIKVDSEDELYLTDDFIVTHNTSLTTAMASHAAINGFKVLQIVFEDRIKQVQRKHIGRITDIESKDLSKEDNVERVRRTVESFRQTNEDALQNNLRIVRFPSGEKTAKFIENFIKKLTNSGFKPDLVIIDYFECLKHDSTSKDSNEFEKEGKTMRKFEAMAGELDVAMWIPSQGTKDAINLELVTMDKVGGSVKKVQIAHVVMSISRTLEDVSNNKATIAILKNRAGGSGKVFNNVDFNNGTCRISTDNVDEMDSLFGMKKKQEDDKLKLQREIVMASSKQK